MARLFLAALAVPLLAGGLARGADLKTGRKVAPAAPEMADVPGGDIFGFTSGTDVGKVGDKGVALESSGGYGVREGRWRGLSQKLEFSGTVADNLSLAGSLFGVWTSLKNGAFPDRTAYDFDGVSFEARYRIVERSAGNPFAMTLAVEPRWSRIDPLSGRQSTGYGAEFKAQVDAPVAERLYWAANANFAVARTRDPVDRTWSNGSASSLSTALAYEALAEKFFIGAEARWQQAWSTGFFGSLEGQALFLGPTFAWKPADNVMLNAVFLPQVAGRAGGAGAPFDLDNFSRANYRVKLAVGF